MPYAACEPKGAVYTKRWVVELLLDLAGYTIDRNLVEAVAVEPAAGDGAFLVPMVERLATCCQRLGRDIAACSDSLIAYELEETSAAKAREVISSTLVRNGTSLALAEQLAQMWVRTGDYLLDADIEPVDFVIGNPPYVRLEEIPSEIAGTYRRAYPTMSGRADLYIAFFEAALRQLKPDGICAFICADRWMRNQYGAELRGFVTSEFSVDVLIEMHDADAFHDQVDAYPAITIIRRGKQGTAVVASAKAEAGRSSPQVLLRSLREHESDNRAAHPDGLQVARLDGWFEDNSPWPYQSPEQLMLLRRLERNFPALEESARVGIGVATGNDRVFITRDPNLVEPSRLLKLALVQDISSGAMNWSGHFLVDPWEPEGLIDLRKYPKFHDYVERHSASLKGRHTAVKNLHGWYRTIDRVTHALVERPKLYIADIKNSLEPVLDRGETYPHHNLYFIQSESWNLEALGGLLLSAIGVFFVESYGVKMRGGYFRFQAQYLRRIRVPSPSDLSAAQIQALAEAFRLRDKERANGLAFEIYGVRSEEMERALGHRKAIS